MDSMMVINLLMRALASPSLPLNMSAFMPGIMPIIWLMEPIDMIV